MTYFQSGEGRHGRSRPPAFLLFRPFAKQLLRILYEKIACGVR